MVMRMLVILVGRLKMMLVSRQSPMQTKQSGFSENDYAAARDKGSTDD